jgi:hypothetical protein
VPSALNPFNELYVTETVGPDEFVHLFSPALVSHVGNLFGPGNVVLQGVQGTGKSMLLNLLKPHVRMAYERTRVSFPVPVESRRYLSAGINLTTSRAQDFGQRPMPGEAAVPFYFGDFLNYWIVGDLLKNLDDIQQSEFANCLQADGINVTRKLLDQVALMLSDEGCWFGYLAGANSFANLSKMISRRVTAYRAFLNFNMEEIPPEISNSKTQIGEPISRTVEILKAAGVVEQDVHFIVRIDQYEELFNLETKQGSNASQYREMVHKALSLREASVSYRIGTRKYSWTDDLPILGTAGRLELERNYKIVDLDQTFRRHENRRTWIFPGFAADVMKRRLSYAKWESGATADLLRHTFGTGLTPLQKALRYASTQQTRLKAVKIEPDWRPEWISFLQNLALTNPLQARLGEAWCRQERKAGIMQTKPSPPFEWQQKKYWMKERIEPALMQIAGRSGQKMIWEGKEDVLHLSGGNILVFVSICQHAWDSWLRTATEHELRESKAPTIETNEQAVGIYEASRLWFNKISERPGGDRRKRFVTYLGTFLQKRLYQDLPLSYPGANGFSVLEEELKSDDAMNRFLGEAVYYGDLFDAPHTTKSKDRKARRKFYLNPILSPYFRLPHIHTKEPLYVTMREIRAWVALSEQEPENLKILYSETNAAQT